MEGRDLPAAPTVPVALMRNARDVPDGLGFAFKSSTGWERLSWRQLAEQVLAAAAGLLAEGGGDGRPIVVQSGNDQASLVLDLAAQSIGDFVVPVYRHADSTQTQLVITATDPFLIFTSDETVLESHSVIAGKVEDAITRLRGHGGVVAAVTRRLETIADDTTAVAFPDDAAQGNELPIVRLTHGVVAAQCHAVADAFSYRPMDKRYSVLPWAHVYERVQAVYGGVHLAMPTYVGRGYANLIADLRTSGATVFAGSSRVFEHLRACLLAGKSSDGAPRVALDNAQASMLQGTAVRMRAQSKWQNWLPRPLLGYSELSKWRVQAAIRARLGRNSCTFTSAFAPMDAATALFFHAIGRPIYEGYGHADAGGLVCTNRPGAYKFATLGPLLPDAELSFDNTGDLCVRGPGMTKPVKTPEVAEVRDGYLRVMGSDKARVSQRGINLSPTLEESVVMSDPLVDQAAVYDDEMWVVPAAQALADWAELRGVELRHRSLNDDDEIAARFQAVSRRTVKVVDRLQPTTSYPSHVDGVEADFESDFGRDGLRGVGLVAHAQLGARWNRPSANTVVGEES